jgi:N-acetylglucosamine-6-sulfatase
MSSRMTPFRKRLLIPVLATLGVTVALVVAAPGTPSTTLGQAAAAQSRPNVLVIETDDQTAQSLRFMPKVNALIVNKGALFENSFVNYSLCCPSRATFLTGEYAHNHGVLGNDPPNGGFDGFEALHGSDNLAVWLQNAGYHTALIGKYLNGYSNNPPVPPGWSEWRAAAPYSNRAYGYTLNRNGTLVHYGRKPTSFKQDVLTRKAMGFVDRRAPKPKPFFLWLTYTAPHFGGPRRNPHRPFNCYGRTAKPAPRHAHAFDSKPLPRLPNFNEANVSDKPAEISSRPLLHSSQIANIRRKYRCRLESLLSVDDGVKKVLRALRANGELNNTLIAYTSDNGYFHGEHRIPTEKLHIYEESIRVPLAMRGPGIPRGVKVGDLAINADLAPTIVDVAEANAGLVMDGRSLIPVAQHPGIERGRQLLVEQPSFEAIRTKRYMYAEHATGEKELYDLLKDRFELRSRHNAPAYASVKAQLATRLHELQTCAGPSCRVHQPDPQPQASKRP